MEWIQLSKKLCKDFLWHNIQKDVEQFIKKDNQCQKQGEVKKASTELRSIPVKSKIIQHIGVDICNPQDIDGFKYIVACINYFMKWSELKSVKDKSPPTVTQFLYEIIYRSGCMNMYINDRGKDFINKIGNSLHNMTGIRQQITSSNLPQFNG